MVDVKLHTGKVWVKKETNSLPGWGKDIVLMPGQGVSYDSVHLIAKLDLNPRTETGKTSAHSTSSGSAGQTDFKNAPITEVVNVLKLRYDTAIEYNAANLKGMYFTGTIRSSDSLASVLNMIARLNGLQIVKTANGYRIE